MHLLDLWPDCACWLLSAPALTLLPSARCVPAYVVNAHLLKRAFADVPCLQPILCVEDRHVASAQCTTRLASADVNALCQPPSSLHKQCCCQVPLASLLACRTLCATSLRQRCSNASVHGEAAQVRAAAVSRRISASVERPRKCLQRRVIASVRHAEHGPDCR